MSSYSTVEAAEAAERYQTVTQAARQLSVHPSTIRRWIDQGVLPAYRIGEKRIGVKPTDLARLVAPRLGRPATEQRSALLRGSQRAVRTQLAAAPRLTEGEQRRGLQALEQLQRQRAQQRTKHGTLVPASWELLEHSREARTRDLVAPAAIDHE